MLKFYGISSGPFLLCLLIGLNACQTVEEDALTMTTTTAAEPIIFPYVTIDGPETPYRYMLTSPSADVPLPLSPEHRLVANAMLQQMTNEETCAGLAAVQVGHHLRMIVYRVEEEVRQWRDDVVDLAPPSVLINPSFAPLDDHITIDWEGCFSVNKTCGEVRRYTAIKYQGYDADGHKVFGIARGFLARLLQHEIDHTNGILCSDRFDADLRRGTIEEIRELRRQERAAKGK